MDNLEKLQNIIGYKFSNLKYLKTALTHTTYGHEHKLRTQDSNERLEFLGDSVLSCIVSEYMFTNYTEITEGQMTKIRASVVCESSLAIAATKLQYGDFVLLGKGENLSGGRKRASLLADAFEAVIGAIYIDGGFEEAKRFVLGQMVPIIHEKINEPGFNDYKTRLQEELQKASDEKINYEIMSEEGPDHDKHFKVQLKWGGKILGIGKGRSKKEAEQTAAKEALIKMGFENEN